MKWGGEVDEFLKHCVFVEQLSSSVAARALSERFGSYVTRNAVIGRLHRLGLSAGVKVVPRPKLSQAREEPTLKVKKTVLPPVFKSEESVPLPPEKPAPAKALLLDDPGDGCRWPFGDTVPFKFCGCPRQGRSSYCESHTAERRQPKVTRHGKSPRHWRY